MSIHMQKFFDGHSKLMSHMATTQRSLGVVGAPVYAMYSIPQALLSIAELVAGIVGLFFSTLGVIFTLGNDKYMNAFKTSCLHIGVGLGALVASGLNIATIGLLGCGILILLNKM